MSLIARDSGDGRPPSSAKLRPHSQESLNGHAREWRQGKAFNLTEAHDVDPGLQPTSRELDTETVADAVLFTDRRESLENEAAEYRLAMEEGLIEPAHVRAELGELLTGKANGRVSDDEITLGLAVFDVTAAAHVLAKAQASGAGVTVDF